MHNRKESSERRLYSPTVNPNQTVAVRAPDPNRQTTGETALHPSQRDASDFNVPSAVTNSAQALGRSVGFWVMEACVLVLAARGLFALRGVFIIIMLSHLLLLRRGAVNVAVPVGALLPPAGRRSVRTHLASEQLAEACW